MNIYLRNELRKDKLKQSFVIFYQNANGKLLCERYETCTYYFLTKKS